MKKVIRSKTLTLILLFAAAISVFTSAAYTRAKKTCLESKDSCQAPARANTGMLWDILSHQFVSAIHLP